MGVLVLQVLPVKRKKVPQDTEREQSPQSAWILRPPRQHDLQKDVSFERCEHEQRFALDLWGGMHVCCVFQLAQHCHTFHQRKLTLRSINM